MAAELQARMDGAWAPLSPGRLLTLANGAVEVDLAPEAGGRIAQIRHRGRAQVLGFGETNSAMIGWGCYPMLPWAGRVRHGRFDFAGRRVQLPLNAGTHAIHGVGFALPWQVASQGVDHADLSLELPCDNRWPFGGHARQRIDIHGDGILMTLSLRAGSCAMPATIGWHPWFCKPDRVRLRASAMYPRDSDGIATLPLVQPTAGPWDDCFVNTQDVVLDMAGQALTLGSDCTHWVLYDADPRATCVEPQSGPPDAFNIEPHALAPGEVITRWFRMTWADRQAGDGA